MVAHASCDGVGSGHYSYTMTRPRGKRQRPNLWPRTTGQRALRERLGCLGQEALVGKRVVGLAAIAQNDVIDDVDTEELSGVHQALGQDAVSLAGLRRPRRMVMAAEQGRGIAEDCGLRRVGCWRGDRRPCSINPPPNRAGTFRRTRLSSSPTSLRH